jgi:energy-coupling factor transporter ATP-binding protein EcfA2
MQELFDLPTGLGLALFWAGRGARLHPVRYIPATSTHSAQKRPLFNTWQKMASSDPALLTRWWTKWPDAWVGLATGDPGFDVVDFDVKDAARGQQSWDALIEAGLIDSHLFDVSTPSGGWHRYFPGTSQRNGQIRDAGVDFRAAGGFVMAPGNPGYEVTAVPAGSAELAGPVDWLACRALLRPDTTRTGPAAPPPNLVAIPATGTPVPAAGRRSNLRPPKPDDTWTVAQAQAEIHRWRGVLGTAKVGSINHTLNDAAMRIGHFVPQFLTWAEAVGILETALSMTDYDGRTWKAADTIRSGLSAGMRQPYQRRPEEHHSGAPAATAQTPSLPVGIGTPPPPVVAVSNERRPVVQKASQIQLRRVRWLWHDRIPAGEITLIAGREGSGKSTFLAWLARMITRGELPGEFLGQPRAVLYAAAEDSWEHTLAPRLTAAGADLDLVYRVAVQTEAGVESNLVLPWDIAAVFELGVRLDAAALMLDPGLSFLDAKVDSFKSQELRPALEQLRRGAERAGMAVAMLCHFNKTQGTDVLSKIAGSRAFAEVARAALAVAADTEEDEEEGTSEERVILSQAKNNLGRSNLPNLTYQIHDTAVPTSEGDAHVGRLVWTGETDRSAEQALNGLEAKAPRRQPGKTDPVQEWIVQQRHPVSVEEIHAEFSQITRVALRKRLSRLAEGGGIYRPVTGYYAPAHTVTPVTLSPIQSNGAVTEDIVVAQDVPVTTPGVTAFSPLSPVTSVTPVTHPPSPSSTLASRERERDKSDSVTSDEGAHARARVTLRPPQQPDEPDGWLVHGDPYRGA